MKPLVNSPPVLKMTYSSAGNCALCAFTVLSASVPATTRTMWAGSSGFRRKAQHFTYFAEVSILCDEGQVILARIFPEHGVRGLIQSGSVHVLRVWVEIRKMLDEARRQVLVEEKLHTFTTNCWPSRSAA